MEPTWEHIRAPGGGAHVRVWFRRLYSEVWGAVLRPTWFHTWIELVDRNGLSWPGRPLSLGVYDKTVDGRSRAILMDQGWEHEPVQLERFDPGYVPVAAPRFTEADFELVRRTVYGGERRDLGPYAFLAAWGPYLAPDESTNCMTWAAEFVISCGGRRDVLERVERGFKERLTGLRHPDRRH